MVIDKPAFGEGILNTNPRSPLKYEYITLNSVGLEVEKALQQGKMALWKRTMINDGEDAILNFFIDYDLEKNKMNWGSIMNNILNN